MSLLNILSLLGAIGLFLYGMHIMADGLAKAAGSNLTSILERLTSRPIKGVLLGAAVTAVIQSSGATTVMVVGFVNSGIMKLEQAACIIMGANIGTTATSWILSLTGIESDSLLVTLLKPSSFAPVLALAGTIMIVFMKKDSVHEIGKVLAGFGFLMIGMDTMSTALEPLKEVPEFVNLMTTFTNPFMGMLVGILITTALQSSSASIGILQALSVTGTVPYGAVLPMIMGQNIGSCTTALFSSVGTNKNARRAAFVHLYFNVIGTVAFMIVFYTINAFHPFAFLNANASMTGIAVIHSMFNLVTTAVLLPNRKFLVKLAALTVPDRGENEQVQETDEFKILDARFLSQPGLALEHSRLEVKRMADLSRKALFMSLGLIGKFSEETAEQVSAIENRVDTYEDKVGTYLMKISARDLTDKESETLTMLLHSVGNFERISDHACNIMDYAKEMHEKEATFSAPARVEMQTMIRALSDIVNLTFDAFADGNVEMAKRVEPLEEVIDELSDQIKQRHVQRLTEGRCNMGMSFVVSDLTSNFERVADHCSNIAVTLIRTRNDGFDTHAYLNSVKRADNAAFRKEFLILEKKYALPEVQNENTDSSEIG